MRKFLRVDAREKNEQELPYVQVLRPTGERVTGTQKDGDNECMILLKVDQLYVQNKSQLREIASDNLRQQYQEALQSQKREQKQAKHAEWAEEMKNAHGEQPRVSEERGVHVIEQTFQSVESLNELPAD